MALTLSFTEVNIFILTLNSLSLISLFWIFYKNIAFFFQGSIIILKIVLWEGFFSLYMNSYSCYSDHIFFHSFWISILHSSLKKTQNQQNNLPKPVLGILLCSTPIYHTASSSRKIHKAERAEIHKAGSCHSPYLVFLQVKEEESLERMIQRRNSSWKWEVGSWLFLSH